MAIILPTLVLVLISIFEIGLAFRDYLTVSYLTREGARLASSNGKQLNADCITVTNLASNMTAGDLARLQQLQIFKADANGNQLLSSTNTFIFTGSDPLNCAHWSQTISWPSTSRQTTVGSQQLDIIGVRMILRHDWVTGFPPYSGFFNVNENTITRMEPEAFG
jgi:Flp pilus assembly protein TadG